MNRRETTVVGITLVLLALVATPLLWVAIMMGNVIDFRMEATNPVSQAQMPLLFILWMAVISVLAVVAAVVVWRGQQMGETGESQEVAAPAAAPAKHTPRPAPVAR